jgi:carbon-monoxide dehydrogenase medium subunit
VRRFELVLPDSIAECLKILAKRKGKAKVVAGGTDLLPQLKNGVINPPCVVDLSGVAVLRTLARVKGKGLRIGASVTARTLELDRHVRSAYPSIAESGALVGSVQVRNLLQVLSDTETTALQGPDDLEHVEVERRRSCSGQSV